MKCYYPTDKSGNRIGFKTPEACIFDTSGTNLTNKLNQLRSDVNGKAASSHGTHVPTPQTANNKIYLRNDNTWHTITPSDIGAAASSHSHSWDSITGKPSLYTTSQIDSKVSEINSNIKSSINSSTLIGNRLIRYVITNSVDYKTFHTMYTLLGFYMQSDSRYDSNYRKNVYWISATTSIWDTKIDADIEHGIIFFGDSTCSVEGTPQIHLYQYVATPSTSKVTINIILYAYDNNPTPIPR